MKEEKRIVLERRSEVMDVEYELYKINERISKALKRIEAQRVDLSETSDYFKDYISEICIVSINRDLDRLEYDISHLEVKRSEDEGE